ncbi:MAG: HNH endonuclease [Lachnospiraceae bacterium]
MYYPTEQNMMRRVWLSEPLQKHRNAEPIERQNHKCPCCVKNGIDTEYAYNEMQGDHIIPWSQGGRTIDSNLQMLCQKCNNDKSNQ